MPSYLIVVYNSHPNRDLLQLFDHFSGQVERSVGCVCVCVFVAMCLNSNF